MTIFDDLTYITDQHSVLQTKLNLAGLFSEFDNGAHWFGVYVHNYDRLTEDFEIHEEVIIPIDIYRFDAFFTQFQSDRSKDLALRLTFRTGGFYGGNLTMYELMSDLKFGKHLTINIVYEHNDASLPGGKFKTDVLGTRIVYSFTPSMFIKPYLQWNSESNRFMANILFNFIHHPGSDLFIVFNEELEKKSGSLVTKNRTFIVKFTYLFNV
jgi:hypothetical protein